MTVQYEARRLDDWYLTINRIYIDRNFYRDRFSIFGHLVEVVGGLSLLASNKQKPGIQPDRTFVPKAIAWWMALCGKCGVRSVENMLWQKFPRECPYCELPTHDNDICRERKAVSEGLNWTALSKRGLSSDRKRPTSLTEWQNMFAVIYPVNSAVEDYPAAIGRFTEELGELAEALRVWPIAPGYFLSEAADVFAWLMHLQNLIHSKRNLKATDRGKELTEWFIASYPDRCKDCQNPVCTCPPILPGTLGRIAHEIPVGNEAFAEGGALLTTAEAAKLFDLGSRTVAVGSTKIETTSAVIQDLHVAVKQLKVFAVENQTVANAHSAQLTLALGELDALASAHRLTQDSLNALAEAIAAMPSESRATVLNFLTGLSSSVWASALVTYVTSLAAR